MNLRVVFIGCVESSLAALESLLEVSGMEVIGIVTRRESKYNADFISLVPLAQRQEIPVFLVENKADFGRMEEWIAERRPDSIFCIGWSWLLSERLLALPPKGVIGFHPAALPQNRGHHPIIWAITLGLSMTASTFFMMKPSADSGAIVSQEPITIGPNDDARNVYDKVLCAIRRQVSTLASDMLEGKLVVVPQDEAKANIWRKRSVADGKIDWRMPAEGVYNLVRALARPYPGAHIEIAGQCIKVWKTKVISNVPINFEPGKILAVSGRAITIKCGTGAVCLLEHEMAEPLPQVGEYL